MPVSVAILGLIALALLWVVLTSVYYGRHGESGYLPDEFCDRLDLDFSDCDFDWRHERDQEHVA